MTYDEFRIGMNDLEVVYFSERNEQRLEILRGAWYKTFAQSDMQDFAKAIEQYKASEDGQKPPRPSTILWLANEAKHLRMLAQRPVMVARFGPLEHECCAKVKLAEHQVALRKTEQQMTQLAAVSEPRAILAYFNPDAYEAIHVECQADKCRCPFCGHEFAKLANPLVIWLAHQYPKQTENWIPYFKGTLVCDSCNLLLKKGARIVSESTPAVAGKPCPIVGQPTREARDFKAEAAGNHEST